MGQTALKPALKCLLDLPIDQLLLRVGRAIHIRGGLLLAALLDEANDRVAGRYLALAGCEREGRVAFPIEQRSDVQVPVGAIEVLGQRPRLPGLRAGVLLGTRPDQVKHVPLVLVLQIAQVEARLVLGLPVVAAHSAPPTATLI